MPGVVGEMENRLDAKRMIGFAVPGIKHYENSYYINSPASFAALSVTGEKCDCQCAHCNGTLLGSMYDASTNEKFIACIDRLADAGCKGILVSGGSGTDGSVPVLNVIDGIAYAKEKGLAVLVHTGLVSRETARVLNDAAIDQVLLDVIGSEKTIQRVYGIDKDPEDYYRSMLICKEAGLNIAPHLVVGLDFGKIDGEYNAIDMVSRAEADSFVLVVLTPKRGTRMQGITPPALEDVLEVFRYAADSFVHRGHSEDTKISLGCARPFSYSIQLEKTAVDLGFGAIAYPHPETIEYTEQLGIETVFYEGCCSLGFL